MRIKQFKALAVLSCFSLWGVGANATPKWESIALNDQGTFYIDTKSISEEDGRKKVWSVLDYKKQQLTGDGKPYLSLQSQVEINCKKKMARGYGVTAVLMHHHCQR